MENSLNNESLHEFQKWLFSPESSSLDIQAENPEDFFANNQALLSVIDSLPNGVTILNPDFKVLYLNKAMQRWFASKRRSYHIKCYRLFHNGQKAPCRQCPAMVSIRTKAPASIIHDCGVDENTGEPFYQHIHTIPVLNAAGEVVLILEYSYNLTEQRHMADMLEELPQMMEEFKTRRDLIKVFVVPGLKERFTF